MVKILTNKQMREADCYTIKNCAIPSLVLMERAGEALADAVEEALDLRGKKIRVRVLCVCGGGNNGGDGFVCARILRERGVDTDVVFFAPKMSEDCRVNYDKYCASGGKILAEIPQFGYAVAVDCLLGTGFKGALSQPLREAVFGMNALKEKGAYILSADIPTGVDGDSGKVQDVAVEADKTLCIGEIKAGVYLNDGIDYSGKVVCRDIGVVLPEENYAELTDKADVAKLLPKRKRNTHKGNYGKAGLVVASEAYSGAGGLAIKACLRSGVGYTTAFLPQKLVYPFMLKEPEALLCEISDGGRVAFNEEKFQKLLEYNCVLYGCGLGVSEDVAIGACYLLAQYTGKLILDADAINALAKYKKEELFALFKNKKCEVLLTPHVKEFSRLSGESVENVLDKGLYAPVAFAKEYGVCVLLKNAVSILSDGERTRVNITGNSGQAKGGSGDVLAGLIAGLCASGLSLFDGALVGAYLCGKSAEIAGRTIGEFALTATDVAEHLGGAFCSLTEPENT